MISASFPLNIPILAFNGSTNLDASALKTDECTAPPPDNFRVTERSTNFISLAWKPTWYGASYRLSVSQKNASGGWDPLLIPISVVSDTFYTVGNLEPGKEYRFSIATRCNNGDPSVVEGIKDDGTLILELVLGGRIPLDPQPVPDCQNIGLNHNWIGFRVDYQEGGAQISNYFEYKKSSPSTTNQLVTWIRRGYYDNPPIYAARPHDQLFPTNDVPKVPSISPFKVIREIGDSQPPELAGFVSVTEKSFPPTVGLCVFQSKPWMTAYTFTPLFAESAMNPLDPQEGTDRFVFDKTEFRGPIAQSPFTEKP
ncbi:MAG: fibronectin type III domain-containing protein [Lewinellaceae bacterium]|nr:fibronectin type III domain-containing protein [Lewinellaceae bacterium]